MWVAKARSKKSLEMGEKGGTKREGGREKKMENEKKKLKIGELATGLPGIK